MRYHQRRFWSVMLGGKAVRLSVYDAHGGEHYAIVSDRGGAQSRADKESALNAIADAVENGDDPGAVDVGNQWSEWARRGYV